MKCNKLFLHSRQIEANCLTSNEKTVKRADLKLCSLFSSSRCLALLIFFLMPLKYIFMDYILELLCLGLVFLSMLTAIQTIARSLCHSLKSNTFDLIVFYHIKTLVEKVMRCTVSMLMLHFFYAICSTRVCLTTRLVWGGISVNIKMVSC